jgi:hypothetical protein
VRSVGRRSPLSAATDCAYVAAVNTQLGPGGSGLQVASLTWRCNVSNTTTATDVAVIDPAFSAAARYPLAAFLAGSRGLSREA